MHCTAVTDDSRMKDVLQLTTAIVMASSAKKNGMTPKVEKQLAFSVLVTISLFKLTVSREFLYEHFK